MTKVDMELIERALAGDHTAQLAAYEANEHITGNERSPEYITKMMTIEHMLAEQGFSESQDWLAVAYELGCDGLEIDLVESYKWALLAAQGGHVHSMVMLSHKYRRGDGTPVDEEQAKRWAWAAVENGHADAQYQLAWAYMSGDNGVPVDDDQAVYWLEQAVDGGFAQAMIVLGYIYQYGYDAPQNKEEAARLYQTAIDIDGPGDPLSDMAKKLLLKL